MKNSNQMTYFAIDLKSFFASVECVERGLNPLSTHLVVADKGRTEKTVCLAVTPSLKAFGIAGRARLFEVVQRVKEINRDRLVRSPRHQFVGKSCFPVDLDAHPDWELDYIIAPPRMAYYIDYSTRVYDVYLRYVQPKDIYSYSIDEVFIDATDYLDLYNMSAHAFALMLVKEVLRETGITATAGIGTNLYLAKVAMDIEAKHVEADKDGVRIAELDEMTYRKRLWDYKPITKFWRIGHGIAKRLEAYHVYTMGDLARLSVRNEEQLFKSFGINAELLIDHAWGVEPCTIADIKGYRPEQKSISRGQVLHEPYNYEKTMAVVREMAEQMSLELFDKQLVAGQLTIDVGYDRESLRLPNFSQVFCGTLVSDHYGRQVPKPAHATMQIDSNSTFSTELVVNIFINLLDKCANKSLLFRGLNLTVGKLKSCSDLRKKQRIVQLDLFTDYSALENEKQQAEEKQERAAKVQEAVLHIKKDLGKNAILKGSNFAEGAMMKERNLQIGGHKA